MDAVTAITVGLIAWAFAVHLPLVYTVLGLTWLLPTLELIGLRTKRDVYFDIAKGLSRYLIFIYAIGGVFGTIITVFLAGLMPVFTNAAGVLLWPVWGVAIVFGVALSLPLIGFYYRSFGKMDDQKHIALGYGLAVVTTVIPAMFRLVFAFINDPVGVIAKPDPNSIVGFDLGVNLWQALGNPTYPPLFLATLFGAIAFTAVLISAIYAWRYASYKTEYYAVGRSFFTKTALVAGVLYAIFAAWYLYAVYQYSPTVAWSIFGSQPSYLPSNLAPVYQPELNLSWMFYMDIVLGLIILAYLAVSLRAANRGLAALAFVLTPVLMDSAEVMNGLAHLPYAIVPAPNVASALIQAYGVDFALKVADTLKVSALITPQINALVQLIAAEPWLLTFSLVMFGIFNALVLGGVYMALAWRSKPQAQ
jgi:cytochrome d ubiquinol oxidase subunit I